MPSTPRRVLKPGRIFAEELEKLELKRVEAADLFGVDSSTISYWARRGVGKKYVANVADVLGVPAEEIVGRGKTPSRVKTVPVEARSTAPAKQAPRLRPELIVELARTPLSDEQADLLRIIINSYGEAA
jgi:hypothetical protein